MSMYLSNLSLGLSHSASDEDEGALVFIREF